MRAGLPPLLIASVLWSAAARAAPPPAERPPEAPPGLSAAEAELWPFPLPDPRRWWDDPRPKPPEAADPLGGRRLSARYEPPPFDNGVDPASYRLWGLMPLQWQTLRGEEMVLEAWMRAAPSVREAVIRIVVRRDGRAFVQARAGLACCEADIGRRVGFDAELPAGSARALLALRDEPLWTQGQRVRVTRGPDLASEVCLNGTAFDLTLLTPGRVRMIHRACADAELGQAAAVLAPVVAAALGHEPRFDLLFPEGADFSVQARAYAELQRTGGALVPDPDARPQPRDRPVPPDDAPDQAPATSSSASISR